MNLGVPHDIARGDTCLGRNWRKRNKAGVVYPPGRAAPTLGAQAWPRQTEIRDASMTPTARPMGAGSSLR